MFLVFLTDISTHLSIKARALKFVYNKIRIFVENVNALIVALLLLGWTSPLSIWNGLRWNQPKIFAEHIFITMTSILFLRAPTTTYLIFWLILSPTTLTVAAAWLARAVSPRCTRWPTWRWRHLEGTVPIPSGSTQTKWSTRKCLPNGPQRTRSSGRFSSTRTYFIRT